MLDAGGKTFNIHFVDELLSAPLEDMGSKEQSLRDMTWQEILQARLDLAVEMEKTASMIALFLAQRAASQGPAILTEQSKHLAAKQRAHMMRMNNLTTELHMRPALSFGCLFFVLIGCPVGIWFSRSDYLSAFISCFMPIVFLYSPIQLCCTNFAKDGKVHPGVALWAANALLAMMALGLFRKLAKN
jgi:lipopolysaccharide export LptBFGC system permease protein LptF